MAGVGCYRRRREVHACVPTFASDTVLGILSAFSYGVLFDIEIPVLQESKMGPRGVK